MDPDHLEAHVNSILTAVVFSMRSAEGSMKVKRSAVIALQNSLEFCEACFARDADRDEIMSRLCECSQAADESVSVAALECIANVMNLYYRHMERYIAALFPITLAAMKKIDSPEIVMQVKHSLESECGDARNACFHVFICV